MSLAKFFRANGCRAAHWKGGRLAAALELARREGKPLLTYVDRYQVFTDMELRQIGELRRKRFPQRVFRRLLAHLEGDPAPPPIFAYKYFDQLDRQYPGSKFILNTRGVDGWVKSRLRFKQGYRACIHGDDVHPRDDELTACWRDDWHSHHEAVRAYFKGRPESLLVFDIEADPIEALVEFCRPYQLDPRHWRQHNAS